MRTHWRRYTLGILIIISFIALSSGCEEIVEWTCKSGDCVAAERVCDGIADCPDGSDETANACLPTICGAFSFRCTYGACVPKDAKCNGKVDCVDGSDEAAGLCKPDDVVLNTICSSQEFQCDSGACISQEYACNGTPECEDKSDETPKACSANFCPFPFFQCGYGACIFAARQCDNQTDCIDGSDEVACEPVRPAPPEGTATISPLTQPPFIFNIPTKSTPTASCTAPKIKNSKLVYAADFTKEIQPGAKVPSGQRIKYFCLTGHSREGDESNVCRNGAWESESHPICTRYCPSDVLNGVTFDATCFYEDEIVDCDNRIRPGTIVETFCRTKYRVPDHNPTQRLLCEEDGEWDYRPSRCEPVCGEEVIDIVPFSWNGLETNITAVPWHVAIYSKFSDAYKQNCGGTIINAKVIITAAHCFWDNANEKLYDKRLFLVGAGKSFRDYSAEEPRAAQFRNISLIAVPEDFQAANNNFRGDIAVVILKEALTFSAFVSPVCIRWETGGAKSLASDTYGQVAGWGKDETGGFSEVLKTTYVPMSSYEVCRKEAGPSLAESITDDKFCVMNKFNQNVCEGDSGGGFVVKKSSQGRNRFYLWGIVSNGVPNSATCSSYEFVNYLNIQYYEDFVLKYEVQNRPL